MQSIVPGSSASDSLQCIIVVSHVSSNSEANSALAQPTCHREGRIELVLVREVDNELAGVSPLQLLSSVGLSVEDGEPELVLCGISEPSVPVNVHLEQIDGRGRSVSELSGHSVEIMHSLPTRCVSYSPVVHHCHSESDVATYLWVPDSNQLDHHSTLVRNFDS